MLQENSLDWAIGEALAFGSLVQEGVYIYKDAKKLKYI